MLGLFVRRVVWSQRLKHQCLNLQRKPFCDNTNKKPTPPNNEIANVDKPADGSDFDPYKEVYNLDFETASKIISSPNRRKQNFGLDWHLVQLFFCCLPSLAIYLVGQYSRRRMKEFEEEHYEKERAKVEAEAKQKELEIKEALAANPVLVEVTGRLDKLEETIKDFVVESKKQSKNLEDQSKLEKSKQEPTSAKPNSSLDNKHSRTATTKTSSNAEGDGSRRDP